MLKFTYLVRFQLLYNSNYTVQIANEIRIPIQVFSVWHIRVERREVIGHSANIRNILFAGNVWRSRQDVLFSVLPGKNITGVSKTQATVATTRRRYGVFSFLFPYKGASARKGSAVAIPARTQRKRTEEMEKVLEERKKKKNE